MRNVLLSAEFFPLLLLLSVALSQLLHRLSSPNLRQHLQVASFKALLRIPFPNPKEEEPLRRRIAFQVSQRTQSFALLSYCRPGFSLLLFIFCK